MNANDRPYRPEFYEVVLWDELTKIANDYDTLARRAKARRCQQADVNYITRCADQAREVVKQLSDGRLKLEDARWWIDTFTTHFSPCRDIVYRRAFA